MTDSFEKKSEAFKAWQACSCSDAQLDFAIASLIDTIETLRAIGDSGHWLMGLHLNLTSMESARNARRR